MVRTCFLSFADTPDEDAELYLTHIVVDNGKHISKILKDSRKYKRWSKRKDVPIISASLPDE